MEMKNVINRGNRQSSSRILRWEQSLYLSFLYLLILLSITLLGMESYSAFRWRLYGLTIDRLSVILTTFVALVGAVTYRYSWDYLDGEAGQARFLRTLTFTIFFSYLFMFASHLLLLFICWFLTSLGLHRLLLHYPDRSQAKRPARKKFLISRAGDIALLAAIVLIWNRWHTLDIQQLLERISGESSNEGLLPIALLIVLAALTKSAQFPFHSWLPETMEAPTPVSALMHAGIINAGGALLIRFSPLLLRVPESLFLLTLVGSITMILGMVAMWAQIKVKRTLAWSTVHQMGFMMIQCGQGAFAIALLHIIGHGFYKAWSFLNSGEIAPSSRKVKDFPIWKSMLLLLPGTICGIFSLWIISTLTQISIFTTPGEYALLFIFVISIGQLWFIALRNRIEQQRSNVALFVIRMGLFSVLLVLFAIGLYKGIESYLSPVLGENNALPDPEFLAWSWISASVAVLAVIFLVIIRFCIPILMQTNLGRAFFVHSLHGFYLGTIADQLVEMIFHPLSALQKWQRSISSNKSAPLSNKRGRALQKLLQTIEQNRYSTAPKLHEYLDSLCQRIPPLWDLNNYVAVNPFLGFGDQSIQKCAAIMHDQLRIQVLPALSYYQECWRRQAFNWDDLALATNGQNYSADYLQKILDNRLSIPFREQRTILSFAERYDSIHRTNWHEQIIFSITRWCGVYVTQGGSYWKWEKGSGQKKQFYQTWREFAQKDRTLEIAGLPGWRSWLATFPNSSEETIAILLQYLNISDEVQLDYLYHIVGSVYGWASYFRRSSWQEKQSWCQEIIDLVAIYLIADSALVAQLAPERTEESSLFDNATISETLANNNLGTVHLVEDEEIRYLFQEALENGYTRQLMSKMNSQTGNHYDRSITSTPLPQNGICSDSKNTTDLSEGKDGYGLPNRGIIKTDSGDLSTHRPDVQAIFCIDVRSEPIRRNLEHLSPQIKTLGFAGFFGIPLGWTQSDSSGTSTDLLPVKVSSSTSSKSPDQDKSFNHLDGPFESSRCPVLLKPSIHLRPSVPKSSDPDPAILHHLQIAPASAFSTVELGGIYYGMRLIQNTLSSWIQKSRSEDRESFEVDPDHHGYGIGLQQQVKLAWELLKNMGLKQRFAPLILLCGHESQSRNNPHAASLDCGACGGHSGALNARLAAKILNNSIVRNQLAKLGCVIPDDTLFLAGVHNTTTEEITILDQESISAEYSHGVARLIDWLKHAAVATRQDRMIADKNNLADKNNVVSAEALKALQIQKANNWSEVRPEWGLARNASFIAARRCRTRGTNLQGRSFLHEYDASQDADLCTLELILSAPMVVASWINLQYFASTIENHFFGCGNKTLHNRLAHFGVVLGNGGDLRTGLALQSVHNSDGSWYHEPLRLQVIVEATPENLDTVLLRQPQVKSLIENRWVRLFSLDREKNQLLHRLPSGQWQTVQGVDLTTITEKSNDILNSVRSHSPTDHVISGAKSDSARDSLILSRSERGPL